MDMAKGTLARHLFKHTSDSNLNTSQAEGPDCSSTAQAESHMWVCMTGNVRLEDSHWEVNLLTKTLGGHLCTY